MALIRCPECGKNVSSSNKNCIHCGYVLDKGTNNLFELAKSSLEGKDYAKVVELANRLLEDNPKNYEAWALHAQAIGWNTNLENLKVEQVIVSFKKALEYAPSFETKAQLANGIVFSCLSSVFSPFSKAQDEYMQNNTVRTLEAHLMLKAAIRLMDEASLTEGTMIKCLQYISIFSTTSLSKKASWIHNNGFNNDTYQDECLKVIKKYYPHFSPVSFVKTYSDIPGFLFFILTFIFGLLGLHKFMTKDYVMGFVYFFTGGLFGLGWFLDLILIFFNSYKDKSGHYVRFW